jgi:hypothetical protein
MELREMSAPIEMRMYLRKLTLDDVRNGINPIRLDGVLFAPPQLQLRYKERLPTTNGQAETVWSEWQDVPYARETDLPNVGDIPHDETTIRQ